MKLIVKVRQVYGNRVIYPACQLSRMFTEIAKTKTLTDDVIALLKRNGFAIEVEQQTL